MNKSESKYFNTAVKMDKALLELVEQKPFEYITVSEICKKADVNRSTFYLHYENTKDLLEETVRYVIDDFRSAFSVDTKNIVFKFSECDFSEMNFISEEYMIPYLLHVRKNKRIFSILLSNTGVFGCEEIFKRLFQHVFNPILNRFGYPESDRKYVMMFYLNGVNAITREWINDDCKSSVEDISRIIHECIFGLDGKLGLSIIK